MFPDFDAELARHFEAIQRSNDQAAERASQRKLGEDHYLGEFVKLKESTIAPVLEKVLQMLMAQGYPAILSTTPPDQTGPQDRYIGLHCAIDPNEKDCLKKKPPFRLSYNCNVVRREVEFFSSAKGTQRESGGTILELPEIHQSEVEKVALEFVRRCFPLR